MLFIFVASPLQKGGWLQCVHVSTASVSSRLVWSFQMLADPYLLLAQTDVFALDHLRVCHGGLVRTNYIRLTYLNSVHSQSFLPKFTLMMYMFVHVTCAHGSG